MIWHSMLRKPLRSLPGCEFDGEGLAAEDKVEAGFLVVVEVVVFGLGQLRKQGFVFEHRIEQSAGGGDALFALENRV
jgi:hypothetical protein